MTVTYTSILNLKISTDSFKINVVDYSKIKVNYNKQEGNEIKSFKSDGITLLNIGNFDAKDWSKFTEEEKASLKVFANNGSDSDSEQNDSILKLFNFDINDDGKITANLKFSSSAKWDKLAQFHINIEDTQKLTNFNDKGYDFWLDELKTQISLEIDQPDSVEFDYNGSKTDYKKNDKTKSVIFQVKNNDFDWNLETDTVIDKIIKSINIISGDKDIVSNFSLKKDQSKKQFILSFNYKEISFEDLHIEFSFVKKAEIDLIYGDAIDFTLSKHRHGVNKTEKDISESKENIKFNNNDRFDFIKDTGIEDKKLITFFEIKPEVFDIVASELKANGYNYLKSVVLSKDRFSKLSSLLFQESEDSDKIKEINNKIEQIDVTDSEKNEQKATGITLTASYQNNSLVLYCPGINTEKNGYYSSGEYYIVNKFKDNKNNYQFSYVDFKWVFRKLDIVKGPIKIVSHLYSMPIKNNPEIKQGFNDIRVWDDLITGKDTGAGTIDNPLMLTENDSKLDVPSDETNMRHFSRDTLDATKGSYKGYIEAENFLNKTNLDKVKLEVTNGNDVVEANDKLLKEKDGVII